MAVKSPRAARARATAAAAGRTGPFAFARVLPSAGSLLAGLALVAIAGGLYAAARETSIFAIRELRIEGAPPGLARSIERELQPVLGTSLVELSGDQVLAALEALPDIRSAQYDRAFPHTLIVSIVRERPVAVLRRGAEAWLVSARGRVLRAIPQGTQRRLPRIWAAKGVPVEIGAVVADPDLLRGVLALRPPEARALPARIRTVRSRAGELTFVLGNGLELRLGEPVDLPLKLAVATDVVPLLAAPSAGGPTYLDLGVPGKPVAGRTLDSEVEVEG